MQFDHISVNSGDAETSSAPLNHSIWSTGNYKRQKRNHPELMIDWEFLLNCIDLRLFNLDTCCGYGYNPFRPHHAALSRKFKDRDEDPDTAGAAVLLPFQTIFSCWRISWISRQLLQYFLGCHDELFYKNPTIDWNRNRNPFRSTGHNQTYVKNYLQI